MIRLRKDHHHRTDNSGYTESHSSSQQQHNSLPKNEVMLKVRRCLLQHCHQCVQNIFKKTLLKAFVLLSLILVVLGCSTSSKVVQILGSPSYGMTVNLTINDAVSPINGNDLTDLPINKTVFPINDNNLTDLPINETVFPVNGNNLTNLPINETVFPISGNETFLTASARQVAAKFDKKTSLEEMVEATSVLLHKKSAHQPFEEIMIDEVQQESLKNLISLELQTVHFKLVSWMFGPHRPIFPPDINLTGIKGNNSFEGGPPANEWLTPNTVVVAHRKFYAGLSNYSITHWEELVAKSNTKNVGMILLGDEFNIGSSFLNDRLDGTKSPFSFLIRDYFFEKLKNAEKTLVRQLGSMTCKRQKLACSVAPPSIVFARLLNPGIGPQFQPTTYVKASLRSRKCYWAGSDRFERKTMVEYFEQSGGCEVYMTSGFNRGHNKTVYAGILANTTFGLVPRGNSFETHRLAEILMFGGIPVMLDEAANTTHMLSYAEPIPLIHGATWKEAEQHMLGLSDNEVDELQKKVLTWWDNYWNCVHDDMRWIMAQAHAVSQGRNLCNDFLNH